MRDAMRRLLGAAAVVGISAIATAQEGPRAVVKRVVDDPATAAPAGAWRAAASGALTDVRMQGPGTRIAATADRTIVATIPPLSGTYTIRAMFQRVGLSSARYGLTLGCTDAGCALTVLLRSDGAVAVQRPGAEAKTEWTTVTFTNAHSAQQVSGPFTTYSFSVGGEYLGFSVQWSYGSNGVKELGISLVGPSTGLSVSKVTTTTIPEHSRGCQ